MAQNKQLDEIIRQAVLDLETPTVQDVADVVLNENQHIIEENKNMLLRQALVARTRHIMSSGRRRHPSRLLNGQLLPKHITYIASDGCIRYVPLESATRQQVESHLKILARNSKGVRRHSEAFRKLVTDLRPVWEQHPQATLKKAWQIREKQLQKKAG